MRFNRDRRTAGKRHAFDNVGVKRSLRQLLGTAKPLGFIIEDVDKQAPGNLAFLLGVINTRQCGQKALARIDVDQRNIVVLAK